MEVTIKITSLEDVKRAREILDLLEGSSKEPENTDVWELDASVRTIACLTSVGLNTLEGLVKYSRRNICMIPGIGNRAINEIEDGLLEYSASKGVSLALSQVGVTPEEMRVVINTLR